MGDLSWAGHKDIGWFEIGPAPEPVVDKKTIIEDQIKHLLSTSDDKVSVENTSITKKERAEWMEYRQSLRELHLQAGFPDVVQWPTRPE